MVCVLTGNGLKDPDTAIAHSNNPLTEGIEPTTAAVAKVMGLKPKEA